MPRLPLQRPPRGTHLARRRRRQHAGPQPDGAPHRAGQRPGRCRALDRLRDRRAWRPARPDRPHLPAPRLPRRAGRGAPVPEPAAARARTRPTPRRPPVPSGSPEAARRLFASAKPIPGTLAAIYLRSRGIAGCARSRPRCASIPRCFYRAHESAPRETWPALVAAVTDLDGAITGVLRTWLARDGSGKAPLATPRRALGPSARVTASASAQATDVMAAGEGLETMLSLRVVLPAMPIVAALSADAPGGADPAVRAAAPLHRPRQRPGGTPCGGDARRARQRGRHRGPRARRRTGDDFNTDLMHARPRGPRGVPACAAHARGRGAVPDRGPASGPTAASARARVGSVLAVGRARPSRWRWCRKRLSPATAARGFLPLSAPRRGLRRLGCRHSSRDKKAVLAVLRCAPALRASPLGAGLSRSRLCDRQKAAHGRGLASRGADP